MYTATGTTNRRLSIPRIPENLKSNKEATMKLKFNACPKCRGDLELRRDIYGMYISCLQCGLQRDLDAPTDAFEIVDQPQTAVPMADHEEGLMKAA
jgi:ssDNA-binding Zn-finger/Zn-ribbon topoisomerase 1